ncbi:hypothetical protein [Mycobacterium sp. 29Ha]|uniref:hypothetical protein n=1 Tax=Mycobacterium sp. 29Ha TaxID=2939268 RepID=UPI002938F020|nr:hypothetical protein [Mycobacterium sp. 29Ha]MDV3133330.1 hypothetical protein [Mycobacterium sp. 29Ha]
MSPKQLQADILAILETSRTPLSTTDLRHRLNAQHTGPVPVVAEQVYRALCTLHRRALVGRAAAGTTRNIYWQAVFEQQEAG